MRAIGASLHQTRGTYPYRSPSASVARRADRTPVRRVAAMATDKEIIDVTQRLLDCIAGGDYETYKTLCTDDLTCFEPEAVGHQVQGLAFHKYYFDNINFEASAASQAKGKPINLNTIVNPKVRVFGDGAVISYIRLTQKGGASPVTVSAEETRVWEKRNGSWVLVHFHKSVTA